MDARSYGLSDGVIDGRMDVWTAGWIDGRTDGWIVGWNARGIAIWMDGRLSQAHCVRNHDSATEQHTFRVASDPQMPA